jgi:hypothetical protein
MVAAGVATVTLLAACATPLVAPSDRKSLCRVAVEERYGSARFRPNLGSSAAGGLVGAGQGALAGLAIPFPFVIITAPLGIVVGTATGAACAAAGLRHPNANTDFASMLAASDAHRLKRALEAEFLQIRPDCGQKPMEGEAGASPDTLIEVMKIEAGMECLDDPFTYRLSVDWRARNMTSHKVIADRTTRCTYTSSRSVEDWFSHPDRAREEIEDALSKLGQRIGAELLSPDRLPECAIHPSDIGRAEGR